MVLDRIVFNRADVTSLDQSMVEKAILGGHISGNGPFTKLAEELLESYLNVNKVLLTTSCTHALELSALLSGLDKGDEVILPSWTFVSTAGAFALMGAKPVFVDSRADTLNIDTSLIEREITKRTKAICVVHYGGVACEMEKLADLAKSYGLTLIEDNAHGLAAKYKGRFLGTFGAMATNSFHETKNLTCGEGGCLVVNDEALIERAKILREKGTNRENFLMGLVDKYTWVDIGSSWVLSDLLAGVLVGQLGRLEAINAKRMDIWNFYHTELADWADHYGVTRPFVPPGCEHVGHVYHLRFGSGSERSRFIRHMDERLISCVFHYQPLHISPIGQRFGGYNGQCPVAEQAGECVVRLPLYNLLTPSNLERIVDAVRHFSPRI
jgi:dTDP-4-amino-4,6-dideoxygalactose transaminase